MSRPKTPKLRAVGPDPKDRERIDYLTIRDRFLTASKEADYVEWLCQVGYFVHRCWVAEEATRRGDEPLDERACWELWDDCTEHEYRGLREDALDELRGYGARRLWADLRFELGKAIPEKAGAGVSWTLKTMGEHIVGVTGLVLFTLLLAWLAPQIIDAGAQAVLEHIKPHG